jgi:hypothetical protein
MPARACRHSFRVHYPLHADSPLSSQNCTTNTKVKEISLSRQVGRLNVTAVYAVSNRRVTLSSCGTRRATGRLERPFVPPHCIREERRCRHHPDMCRARKRGRIRRSWRVSILQQGCRARRQAISTHSRCSCELGQVGEAHPRSTQ